MCGGSLLPPACGLSFVLRGASTDPPGWGMVAVTLYAQYKNAGGKRQPLPGRLHNVAELERARARAFDGGNLAYLPDLWHDGRLACVRRQSLEFYVGIRREVPMQSRVLPSFGLGNSSIFPSPGNHGLLVVGGE